MTITCPPTNLYHEAHPYRKGNSLQGLQEAILAGHSWIDWDNQESKDHQLWNMHWPWLYQDKFSIRRTPNAGPLLRSGRRRVKSLDSIQLTEVRSPEKWRPHKTVFMLARAAAVGKNVELELKVFPSRTALLQVLQRITELQRTYPGFKVRIKVLQGVLGKRKIIRLFRLIKKLQGEAEVTTLYLNHSEKPVKFTSEESRVVDMCRGKWEYAK